MDLRALLLPIIAVVIFYFGARFIWGRFAGKRSFQRASSESPRSKQGLALLESAALVSLYASFAGFFADIPMAQVFFLGIAFAMFVIPELTRPLLGLLAGSAALLQLDWRQGSLWLLLVVMAYYILCRFRQR